jgi:1-aminocyclopropane-1-carboxylate deaminase
MRLIFLNRDDFKNASAIIAGSRENDVYWIKEGGYGPLGAEGAADILSSFPTSDYTHIICAAGTGTMMAGLIKSALAHQEIIGISVLKNHYSLKSAVEGLLTEEEKRKTYSFEQDHHFGGYAKHPKALLDFMCKLWKDELVPTDIVYTGKALYAADQLIKGGQIGPDSRVLIVHSGGLQGNASLASDSLPFL